MFFVVRTNTQIIMVVLFFPNHAKWKIKENKHCDTSIALFTFLNVFNVLQDLVC